jgi:hypothetical protein
MDYTKYLKIAGAAAALILAYALGHHQGLASRPVAARPTPAMVQRHLAAMKAAQCNCHKRSAKPKTAKHKKHKEKAGKAKQEAPPTKK